METPDRRPASNAPKAAGKTADKSDLEVFLRVKGPELLQKHAANILMVVLLLIAAGFYLYSRSRNKAAEQAATNQNTAIAYDFAQQARAMFDSPAVSDRDARARQEKARDVFAAVELVLTSDAGPEQKAAAQLSRAEVLWQLANSPDSSLATTQPASGFTVKSPAAYLDDAEQAYTEIVSKYADQKEYAAIALISLAAVCETRGDFDKAKDWYAKVNGDPSLRSVYHEIAASRAKSLEDIRKPHTLGPPTSKPTTGPTGEPDMRPSFAPPVVPAAESPVALPPSTMPSTMPATQPG
jgi:hypothetical protein